VDDYKLGVLLWNQSTDWPAYETAARRVDELGYAHLWAWDHLHAIFGEPQQNFFEGWLTLGAWAKVTSRVRLGLLVGAVTFRNPGLVAKLASTLDHICDGRSILGLGGAWFAYEHTAYGIDFGHSPGARLAWLDEAVGDIRQILDGVPVTSPPEAHFEFRNLRQEPLPVQRHLPIMIGGSGERKTLRTVAKHADMWNAMGTPEFLAHKVEVLRRHCDEVGRDPAAIEFTVGCKPIIRDSEEEARRAWARWMAANQTPMSEVEDDNTFWPGTPEQIAERLLAVRHLGFGTAIAEIPAPFDDETLERFIGQVKPLVDRG
jgi:alkanesulfonate monooxygenase SsuD/methylene tetrahydromethanopterin reductase-like flavin-dependent oxidoreductase (luciferase family)